MKKATSIEEQISTLQNRGMKIGNTDNAKKVLSDIGYYRLGFYWFPYEQTYPERTNRNHNFVSDTTFEKSVLLYDFDFKLRSILSPYLYRIEVNLRTALTYIISNDFKDNPIWFSDPEYVTETFVKYLPVFYNTVKKSSAIKCHHINHRDDIYAPAWKTLEYMSFGDIIFLYKSIKDTEERRKIPNHFDYTNERIFNNHIETIKVLRNQCAHGHNVFDLNLQKSIRKGFLNEIVGDRIHNILGCMIVASHLLETISNDVKESFLKEIKSLVEDPKYSDVKEKIQSVSMFVNLDI